MTIDSEIYLISSDEVLNRKIVNALSREGYLIFTKPSLQEGLTKIYESPPSLIMVDSSSAKGTSLKLLQNLKRDNLFSQIPVIIFFMPEVEKNIINWQDFPVDDYLTTAFNSPELINRVSLCINRFKRALDPNPLTRLPGNTSILREIQDALDQEKEMAIAYLDVDNFKAFNDKYGFARGDEALRMTARILSNIIHDYIHEEAFVGHVGGDDFVFMVPSVYVEKICERIIQSFDSIVPSLYDETDREKGYIISKDRGGKKIKFPLMTISVAIVLNDKKRFKHYGEVSEAASEVKKQVKKFTGSNFMSDRRTKGKTKNTIRKA